MKALIVDDEEDVRDSIRMLVDWETYGITDILEASNGGAAMELIREEKPEIVFTDMKMPGVDGLELLQWIEGECPGSKRIVISGYDDYTYMRRTIKHGGLDYLLKPINRGELLEALRNAVNSWRKEEEERRLSLKKNVEINQTMPAYWDKVLSSVVSQPGYYRSAAAELSAAFEWSGEQEFQVVLLPVAPLPRLVLRQFGRNLDLLHFLMTNICNEILGSVRSGFAFKHTDPHQGIVLLYTGDPTELDTKLVEMNDAFARILGTRFRFAYDRTTFVAEAMHMGFLKAMQAARSISFLQDAKWIYSGEEASAHIGKRVVLADYGSRIAVAVYSGDLNKIEHAVAQWIKAIEQMQEVTLEHLKYWQYEYELLRDRILREANMEPTSTEYPLFIPPSVFPIDSEGRLSLADMHREWTETFGQMANWLRKARPKENNVIYAVKQYIDANYRENLLQQEVAGQFFVSREYVSRKFKQEFNENISDYLERIRIEHAKALLSNMQYSISSIAEMVGYQDARYFSKIFGKLTGMTPREYRKQAESEKA